jgi:hypothetical protein
MQCLIIPHSGSGAAKDQNAREELRLKWKQHDHILSPAFLRPQRFFPHERFITSGQLE